MEYTIKPHVSGVFRSLLELRWFVWFRQQTSAVQYVGHVDTWRDFVVQGQSIEIKPQGIGDLVSIQDAVQARVPDGSQLDLYVGAPDSHRCFALRNGVWHGVS